MILDEYVEVTMAVKNIKYYESLGYEVPRYTDKQGRSLIKRGTKIKVKVKDLNPKSTLYVNIKCDKCGCIVKTQYNVYTNAMEKYGNYYCSHCKYDHTKKTCNDKYGVDSPLQLKEIRDKIKSTNLKKYGYECVLSAPEIKDKIEKTNVELYGFANVFQSDEIKDKIKNTNLERYGVEYVSQNDDIKQKVIDTNMARYGVPHAAMADVVKEKRIAGTIDKYGVENVGQNLGIKQKISDTFYKNGTVPTSSQQLYIFELLMNRYNVELNYLFQKYFIDIFIRDLNIAIEIDGGGHDLNVKTGQISEKEFNIKETIRESQIRSKGIKIIRLIIPTDKLPSDNKIFELIENAINYFNTTNHTWIKYYIEENKFVNAENQDGSFLDYGELWNGKKLSKIIQRKEVV